MRGKYFHRKGGNGLKESNHSRQKTFYFSFQIVSTSAVKREGRVMSKSITSSIGLDFTYSLDLLWEDFAYKLDMTLSMNWI